MQTDSVLVGNGGFGSFTGLCEGVYVVEITDGNGCTDIDTVYVDAPDYLYVSGVVVDDASAGNSDGSALITIVGGTAPYQFSFDNGSTWTSANPITGLAADFYIMLVEDANGCQTIFCFIVNEDPGCTNNTTLFLQNPVSCSGACDGALSYAYSDAGSNPPYTIELSNNGTVVSSTTQTASTFNGTFTGLCAGNYSLVVYNADGCASFVSNYTLTQPSPINVAVNVTSASTGNNNGVAEVVATGGTGQLIYSLDGTNFQSSNVFDTLSAGVYVVYITDENGCTGIHTFVVTETSSCNIVVTAFNTAGISCAGGCTASVGYAFNDVNINPPYVITLQNTSGGIISTQTVATGNGGSGSFTDLCAGDYVVMVTDVNGCQSSYSVTVSAPSYMQIMPTWINATAGNNDGSIDLNITGGTALYQYSLDNQATWNTGTTISNLGAGFYIIYVQDANGCMQIVCVVLDDSNVIGTIELTDEIMVYPNPTGGYVFIASANIKNVVVYGMSGQMIPVAPVIASNGLVLDLTEVADGVYLLEIELVNGDLERVKVTRN
ncbi:MAG: T9SS type A sorting domain-containing protein [Crocinitomicaceae bacterium]|nr:T9SS type A sorting domain-containing protein [Crocinitomicaceae bacterium]